MNYIMRYDYDNYDEIFLCTPSVRHGTCLELLGCTIKFYQISDPCILVYIDATDISKTQAEEKLTYICKILSFIFALPFYSRSNVIFKRDWDDPVNNLLSKSSLEKVNYLEGKILKFSKVRAFFNEALDLLMIAYDNLYNNRDEDAFIYFFKVIERISKQNYLIYMERHHTKTYTKRNKNELNTFIKKYAKDFLSVAITDEMLNRKVDLLYKTLKYELYGSIFNKISLFVTQKQINVDVNIINKLVKARNKIAHGDIIEAENLSQCLGLCEYLAMQMFSVHFFQRKYEKIHIRSYRFSKEYDVYGSK